MTEKERRSLAGYKPEHFTWRVRKVFDWRGGMEVMIEFEELHGCVSYGETVRDAKMGLTDSLYMWIRMYGESQLPDLRDGAQLIHLDPPMDEEEFRSINYELRTFTN
ncbi:hypothetical protein JCM9140_1804 [Halalkalibacter wakoensis JCM 9140]|uniref:Type II toxin-antitoxin system HicB family antitoxin n=1 Tax=Halalkalibacter wakoensis JCM 9140 TaxID=1236970 RepID=W4Q224_9BACI|nr:hypothetical protein [Halalkalibacter wakoensis]GAE25788.1 hypothetical protein JCM9140_1804 [Halalkalibacter wakoensis JCM 9140]